VTEKNEVARLIHELMVNDDKEAHEIEEPKEPREVMTKLVQIGKPVLASLLGLLRNTTKHSCICAIKVLGEIQDPVAVKPLIDLWDNEKFNLEFDDGYQNVIVALQKIGTPALQSVLSYLEEQKKRNNKDGIIYALLTLSGIKDEQSYVALTESLSFPDGEVQDFALESLVYFGDERASKHIAKLFEDPEWAEYGDLLKNSIRLLTEPNEYRKILLEHRLVGLQRMKSFKEREDMFTRQMTYAYEFEKEFEGIDADRLNNVCREIRIRESLESNLQQNL